MESSIRLQRGPRNFVDAGSAEKHRERPPRRRAQQTSASTKNKSPEPIGVRAQKISVTGSNCRGTVLFFVFLDAKELVPVNGGCNSDLAATAVNSNHRSNAADLYRPGHCNLSGKSDDELELGARVRSLFHFEIHAAGTDIPSI